MEIDLRYVGGVRFGGIGVTFMLETKERREIKIILLIK
jgi:hypothetical protein